MFSVSDISPLHCTVSRCTCARSHTHAHTRAHTHNVHMRVHTLFFHSGIVSFPSVYCLGLLCTCCLSPVHPVLPPGTPGHRELHFAICLHDLTLQDIGVNSEHALRTCLSPLSLQLHCSHHRACLHDCTCAPASRVLPAGLLVHWASGAPGLGPSSRVEHSEAPTTRQEIASLPLYKSLELP